MATHSSILARRIPWTEEPDGLQSKGSQRVKELDVLKQFSMHAYIISNMLSPLYVISSTNMLSPSHVVSFTIKFISSLWE